MATLSITASGVVPSESAVFQDITAGAALTAGQPYYLDSTDGYRAKPTDADAIASARVQGIAQGSLAAGQRGKGILRDPALAIGATVVPGRPYFVHGTAGAIGELADVTAGQFVSLICIATTTTTVRLEPVISDTAVPA